MIAELISAVQSVQALTTLLSSANKLSNYNEIVGAVSEVSVKLMQANSTALALQEKILELQKQNELFEEQIKLLNDWSSEAQSYEEVQVYNGVFVVVPKERSGKLQSTLKLCINCFTQKTKSVLQHSNEEMRRCGLTCHRCSSKMIFNHYMD
jgi:hypothetical protein